jgi:CBS domain-containing protein
METMAPSTGYLAPSFAHATVGDAMHPAVLTCDPATPLVTVAQRMAGEGVHAIVVLAGDARVAWGVVNDTDLLRHADRVEALTADQIASRDVVEAFPDEPLASLAARMVQRAVTHAIVLARESGRPVGIVSTLDIARVLAWGRA